MNTPRGGIAGLPGSLDCPDGPENAVINLYRMHVLGLTRLAVVMLGDRPAAEDVVQDAFCGLYTHWGRLSDPAKALPYLRSSVLNGCRNHRRRRFRAGREPTGWENTESAAAPAGLPAYDIALAPGPLAGQSTRAVVRATATGAVLATVRPPRPYGIFTGVTGAADDRTFVLAAQPGQQPAASGRVATKLFLLRLDPAAGTARLAALPIPAVSGKWLQGAGIALSPDGGKLAAAVSAGGQSVIEVFDLAGGPTREWRAHLPNGNVVGTNLLGANALSWAADGRTLAFDTWGPARAEVHALDTAAPGASLSASRLVMTFPHWAITGSVSGSAIITPDGTKIIAMEVHSPPAATEIRVRQFSATNGRSLGILATLHYRKGAITGWPNVLWSNPAGSQLIISTTRLSAAPSKSGNLTPEEIGTVSRGRFAPLPGIPGGQRPVW